MLKKKLGARIRELRKYKKYTQEQLAEKIDMDKPNLSNIERGKRFMTAETLDKIASALEVDVQELFDFGHFEERETLCSEIDDFVQNSDINELRYIYKIIIGLRDFKK